MSSGSQDPNMYCVDFGEDDSLRCFVIVMVHELMVWTKLYSGDLALPSAEKLTRGFPWGSVISHHGRGREEWGELGDWD